MEQFDVVILGAGAAGLMCAARAAQRGRSTLILDHNQEPGAKILISGGGRCNFTNLDTSSRHFWSQNRDFCRSALARYTPADFVALVRKHGVAFHEKAPGQLFCDSSARAIVDLLVAECEASGATLRTGVRVTGVTRGTQFRVATNTGDVLAAAVVVATGGLSIPKLGATGLAFDLARQFGLNVIPPRPGLVPFTLDGEALALAQGLTGLAFDCAAGIGKTRFADRALFTHRGLSGPAMLQISTLWEGGPVTLNLLPGQDAGEALLERKRARPKAELKTILAELLPQRLAAALAPDAAGRMADLPDKTLRHMAQRLASWQVIPAGTEGFAKAEVTAGGVDTAGLSSRTMAANAVPGLFFIGEAVDVTGWLGGYNFQWAWASGWSAAEAV